MAVKKSEIYSSLWAACDKLRGGMDSSEYKNYILTLLFIKYVSDKYMNKGPYEDLTVFDKANDPEQDPDKKVGCSFSDLVSLKGTKNIGEGMDKIIARLAEANSESGLKGIIDIAHFNDEIKLGSGKEMVDKLTDLISIFQRPELDFSKNRAEGDDIIGDAYEYLMRKFATESGKSKGQFYTPAEVSRIMAHILGIDQCDDEATVCDPACGSGSLLIRAVAAAPHEIMGFGQEKEITTAGLAKMNAVLHKKPQITIKSGNTFANPQFFDEVDSSQLQRFDYIVANPPFSIKNWTDGISEHEYGRFEGYGDIPPEKNGDYAWLMHIIKSLKSNGKAAVILPHGVLFRGNAESTIRKTIIKNHWIKGIIGLPANLFYGTGIPACIIVIDKEDAYNRKGIFMIDASRDFIKDGDKNRLRERDIYKIVTTFNNQIETDPKYARFVPYEEIESYNNYNLNISRYIDSSEPEDLQDIYAHVYGGIPSRDIDNLRKYWESFPTLKQELLDQNDMGYYQLKVAYGELHNKIQNNKEFLNYNTKINLSFSAWKLEAYPKLTNITHNQLAKDIISDLSNNIIEKFKDFHLIDKYDVYQVLLEYWNEVMNDDVSLIISDPDGYAVAKITDNVEEQISSGKKKGEIKIKGWDGRLIPKTLVIDSFFKLEKDEIIAKEKEISDIEVQLTELFENEGDESVLADFDEISKIKLEDIKAKIQEITLNVQTDETIELETLLDKLPLSKKKLEEYVKSHPLCQNAINEKGTVSRANINERLFIIRSVESVPINLEDDVKLLYKVYDLIAKQKELNKLIKDLKIVLDKRCRERYITFTYEEIIELLVNKKWFASIENGINSINDSLSNQFVGRIKELRDRYAQTLQIIDQEIMNSENELAKMIDDLTGSKDDLNGLMGLKSLFGDARDE